MRENIDPNTADTKYGRTHCGVLPWLSWCGGKGLLERERINPNIADTQYGRTPLGSAAMGGHEGRVKLLLEREDINPNTPEIERSLSPLEYTTNGGHEGSRKVAIGKQGYKSQHCGHNMAGHRSCGLPRSDTTEF